MNERKQSCDLEMTPENAELFAEAIGASKPEMTEIELTAQNLGITPAKLKSMREHAMILRRSDSRIKPSTIRKKILEKYKIKLV